MIDLAIAPDAARLLWPHSGRPPQYLEAAEVAALEEALGRGYLDVPERRSTREDRSAYTIWRGYCARQRLPLVWARRPYPWQNEWARITLATDPTPDGPSEWRPDGPYPRRRLDEAGYARAGKIALGVFAARVEDPQTVAACRKPLDCTWHRLAPVVSPHYVFLEVHHSEADLMARTLLDLCAEHLEDAPGN
jgi:hypothetical protein